MIGDGRVVDDFRPFTDFVFSPDVKYVAAISEDGCLRVIDALAEQYAVLRLLIPVTGTERRIINQACRLLRRLFRVTDMRSVVTRQPVYYRDVHRHQLSRGINVLV
jgi:hypothetical protein